MKTQPPTKITSFFFLNHFISFTFLGFLKHTKSSPDTIKCSVVNMRQFIKINSETIFRKQSLWSSTKRLTQPGIFIFLLLFFFPVQGMCSASRYITLAARLKLLRRRTKMRGWWRHSAVVALQQWIGSWMNRIWRGDKSNGGLGVCVCVCGVSVGSTSWLSPPSH